MDISRQCRYSNGIGDICRPPPPPPPKVCCGITIAPISTSPHYNMGAPNKGKGKPKTSRGSQGPDPDWQDPFFNGPSRSGNVPWEGDHDYKTDVSHGGSGTDRDRRNTHTQDNTDDPSFQSGQHDADDPFASRGILNSSGDSVLYNAGEPAVGPEDHYTTLPIQQSSAYAGGYGVDQHGHDPESSSSFVPEQSEQSGQQYDPTLSYPYDTGGDSDLDQVQAQFSGMSMNQGYYATRPFDHVDSTSTGGYDHTREDVQQSEDPAYLEQTHGGFNQEASGSGHDPEQPQTRKKVCLFL